MVIWGRHGLRGLPRKLSPLSFNEEHSVSMIVFLLQCSPMITQSKQALTGERASSISRLAWVWGRIWRGWRHSLEKIIIQTLSLNILKYWGSFQPFIIENLFLKIDIEWAEFQAGGFSDWFSSGVLQNVTQLGTFIRPYKGFSNWKIFQR